MNAIRRKRVYRGRLSYLVPGHSNTEPEAVTVVHDPINSPESTGSGSVTHESDTTYLTCDETERDTDASLGDSSHAERPSLDSQSQSRKSYQTCTDNSPTDVNFPSDIAEPKTTCASKQDSKSAFSKPLADLLVPLSSPLPETWVSKEDDFLNICFATIPCLSRTAFSDPHFQVGSGKIRLIWIDGAATRLETLKVFTSSETGKHIELEQVKLIDAKAFRIEPITSGIMTIDGEVVSSGPIQGQIHPHMGYMMSRKRKSKQPKSS